MDGSAWLVVLQIAVTVVVALVGAFIAWQQHQLARKSHAFTLYERRRQVYDAISSLLGKFLRAGKFEEEDLVELNRGIVDAPFVFDDDVWRVIQNIRKDAIAVKVYRGSERNAAEYNAAEMRLAHFLTTDNLRAVFLKSLGEVRN